MNSLCTNILTFNRFPKLNYSCKEAVNTLCTNLMFTGQNYKRIMITSVNSTEGKSFLSMQIMRTLAELGKTVVLVDADLRRSMIDARFKITYDTGEKHGLVHYLAEDYAPEDILYRTNVEGAYFVPIGIAVSNSLALLNSPRFQYLLDQLLLRADYVLVDAPPAGLIVDAAEIARSCDGALFTVGYNMTRRRELWEAKQQIERSGCVVLGSVLNNVPTDAYHSRTYFGRSYYKSYQSYKAY
jgi:protein-tyrosine kinase